MNKRFILLLAILVVLALTSLTILFRAQRLTVGFQPGSVNYPMMYAIEAGYFKNQGLNPEVQVFRSANDALDAVLGGSVFTDSENPKPFT